ncbi:hypothetical protein C3L33_16503, partial [Rhododendron williamsianum]
MENDTAGTGACSSETANGGEVVWSCNQSDAASADHLVVMVHGILGSATDWKFAAEQFVRMLPDKVFVHCSERNAALLTLDGVDVMGERLAGEVLHVIKQKPSLQESKGTIGGLEPMNFITVATPHLGSRGNKQVPLFFGVTVLEKAAVRFSHLIFKKTGQHLFLAMTLVESLHYSNAWWKIAMILLHVWITFFQTPSGIFNVGYDRILYGWLENSSIRRNTELPKWEDSLNEKYPHIVYEEHCKAYDTEVTEHCDSMLTEDDDSDKLEEELVTGLSHVSWEKVDVSFHSSRLRFAAHSVIQVALSLSSLHGITT